MAAEPDDQKAGDDEDKRSGRERRRPPLTIDLTAEPVTGKGNPADASGSSEGRGSAGSGPGSFAGYWASLVGRLPPTTDREGWVGLGSAAALGGVVALVLLMLLQGIGILPSPGTSAARQAADQARAVANATAAVDRRLAAVEAMTGGLPGIRGDVTAATNRVSALEKAAAAAPGQADVDGLRSDLAALRTRVQQAPAAATAADVASIGARVGRIETALAATPGSATAPVPPAAIPGAPADTDARLASLAARLDAAEAAIARLSAPAAAAPAGAVAARSAALDGLRRAVNAGSPFAVELDAVAATGVDPVTTGLRPYAISGIATREALRADFGKVADAILAATQPTDDSLFGRLVAGARGLVTVRPSGPIAGDDPPAIVSRMEAAVAATDFATALREREALPAAGKMASADWAVRVSARVTADGLLASPVATGSINR